MSNDNRVTDERLADLLERDCYRMYQSILPMELSSMLAELQSLRSKPVAGVEVKPVAWRWRGPRGGWISDDTKPTWPSEPLYASPQPEAVITEEMVERAYSIIWPATEWNDGEHACREFVRAALTAALKEA